MVYVKGILENDLFFSRLKFAISAAIGCEAHEVSIIDIFQENSLVVVIFVKECYLDKLLNMKGKDHKRLQRLNVDYFIANNRVVFIEREKPGNLCILNYLSIVNLSIFKLVR